MAEKDDELLKRALLSPEGDLRAFEELVQKYQKRVVANCRYITRDSNNAEDLAQEVFVKAYFGLQGFEGRSSVGHWLQKIKVNHCLNHLKKQQREATVTVKEPDADDSVPFELPAPAERPLESMAERQIIERVLDSMSATLRIPLILRDMDDLSYEDIAEMLRVGLSAVKMRIKRARQEFRERYELETQLVSVSERSHESRY
jgi:RNA polymerase sigma-70 factor, ECF subfamily